MTAALLPNREAIGQRHASHTAVVDSLVPGQVLDALPPASIAISHDGTPIFYCQGVFFRMAPAGYVVIRAPLGVSVPTIPAGATRIDNDGRAYWYDRGTFYTNVPGHTGFVTVLPPVGCVVPSLPTDVSAIADINGVLYYLYAGVFYRPILRDGRTVYLVADP
jgi:hypothetical protein